MRCDTIDLGDGGVAIVCSRGARRKTCSSCKKRPATKLCDAVVVRRGKGVGTCDRDLCATCAQTTHEPGAKDSTDLCPVHAEEAKRKAHGFEVTDPEHDAPDGAIVDGFERSGDRWRPVTPPRRPPLNVQASLDFQPPTRRKDSTK